MEQATRQSEARASRQIGIDLAAGMPLWWTASEGLSTIVFGALMFILVRYDN